MWFARPDSGSIGWTQADGTVHELTVGGSPRWIAGDGAGGVWVLDPASATLDRRDATGARLNSTGLGYISAETVSVALAPLATDSAGSPWVARRSNQTEIGHRRSDGSFAWSILPTPSRSYPLALAAGPDGAMWGTAQSDAGGVLFRADATGAKVVRTFPMTTIGALTSGPDGNLWTSLADAGVSTPGRFVRIDPSGGVLQQITAPTGTGAAEHLAATPTGVAASVPGGTVLPSIELPIVAAYQRLGGTRSVVGAPTAAEQPIPAGWTRTFVAGRMYWSPGSGAHETHGLILARYLTVGADRSVIGLPVTDEFTPPATAARASRFQRGLVLWSARTGAHEVHGLILARYDQLGGAARTPRPPTQRRAERRPRREGVPLRARGAALVAEHRRPSCCLSADPLLADRDRLVRPRRHQGGDQRRQRHGEHHADTADQVTHDFTGDLVAGQQIVERAPGDAEEQQRAAARRRRRRRPACRRSRRCGRGRSRIPRVNSWRQEAAGPRPDSSQTAEACVIVTSFSTPSADDEPAQDQP